MAEEDAKPMTSLEDFNTARAEKLEAAASSASRPNGIACPDCGAQLLDTNPREVIRKDDEPAKKDVHCEATDCGFRATRLA